ncbi:hypothetical protein [Bifidobacterium callitrichos]|uniref:Ribonuclease n=1 Tax=Bifidobacterium callitrichos DSM 23973 TaxID=1437609 RepID=A0A087ACQ9_9BIFI|nr:hypothetical protein [Bifidobacterium callitrichos]KFI56559.1 ribonuclease [Bifidobacterium callitrichos DSM 23973]
MNNNNIKQTPEITPSRQDALLWLDIETTGLDPDAGVLEVGMRCTSMDAGSELSEGVWLVRPSELSVYDFDARTLAMHTGNGLLREVMCSSPDVTGPDVVARDLEEFVAGLAREYVLHPAGSNVQHFDLPVLRGFLEAETGSVMDWMDEFLSYRALDVTALRLALTAVGEDPYAHREGKSHRVMDCIDGDVAFYRRFIREHLA